MTPEQWSMLVQTYGLPGAIVMGLLYTVIRYPKEQPKDPNALQMQALNEIRTTLSEIREEQTEMKIEMTDRFARLEQDVGTLKGARR